MSYHEDFQQRGWSTLPYEAIGFHPLALKQAAQAWTNFTNCDQEVHLDFRLGNQDQGLVDTRLSDFKPVRVGNPDQKLFFHWRPNTFTELGRKDVMSKWKHISAVTNFIEYAGLLHSEAKNMFYHVGVRLEQQLPGITVELMHATVLVRFLRYFPKVKQEYLAVEHHDRWLTLGLWSNHRGLELKHVGRKNWTPPFEYPANAALLFPGYYFAQVRAQGAYLPLQHRVFDRNYYRKEVDHDPICSIVAFAELPNTEDITYPEWKAEFTKLLY